MPSRSNNVVMPVGNPQAVAALRTGLPRHTTEYEMVQRYRPDFSTERYPTTAYNFSGLEDVGDGPVPSASVPTPASDPISYIMGVLGPSGVGLVAIGVVLFFLFRKGKE